MLVSYQRPPPSLAWGEFAPIKSYHSPLLREIEICLRGGRGRGGGGEPLGVRVGGELIGRGARNSIMIGHENGAGYIIGEEENKSPNALVSREG